QRAPGAAGGGPAGAPATAARRARGGASVHRRCASAPLAARAPAAAPLFPPRQLGLTDAIGIDAAALALRIAPRRRAGRRGRRVAPDRGGGIRARPGGDARAAPVAQGPRLHLRDLAGREVGELERAERHADQAVDLEAEVTEHVLHLAVLALPDREGEPHVAALGAMDRGLDRTIADAVDGDAGAQRL